MITEDYVSFETAKLLEEKGFDVPCTVWYAEYTSQYGGDTYNVIQFDNHNRFEEGYKFLFYVPTLQMAMKWLREKEIFVEVTHTLFSSPHKYQYSIFRTEPEFYTTGNWHKSYEEACEAAIKYCLENLI